MRGRSLLQQAPILVLVVAVLVGLVAFAVRTVMPDRAADACREAVLDQLKSPSSAEFSEVDSRDGDGGHVVSGEVDSENGFGASIRNHFTCAVEDDGSWLVTNVDFGGPG